MVRMTELIDQSLASLSLLHDALLVVLAERPRKLVIVHSWSVLSEKEKIRYNSFNNIFKVRIQN